MKSNWTREEVNDLFDQLTDKHMFNTLVDYSILISRKNLAQFKKDKGLVPTLESNMWVRWTGNAPTIGQVDELKPKYKNCYSLKNTIGGSGEYTSCHIDYLDILTNEEVEQALITNLSKLGIVEGSHFDSVKGSDLLYEKSNQKLTLNNISYSNGKLYTSFGVLFYNGEFAKLSEPKVKEVTISDAFTLLEKEYGCKVQIIKD